MKITIPQKFPSWISNYDSPYSSDIARSRNIRLDEIKLSGETDVDNLMSLTSLQTELVTSIFLDPDHLVSFALKDKSYYIDSLTAPTPTQYTVDLADAYDLNPQSTGIFVYPRGYPKYDETSINSSTGLSSSDINTFVDLTNYTRTYTYTAGQKVIGAEVNLNYTQSTGTNRIRVVVTDSTGDHTITEDPSAVTGHNPWDFWFKDGDAGCNLNETTGFVLKIQIATDTALHNVNFASGNSYINWMLEIGTSNLISTGEAGLYTVFDDDGSKAAKAWYPGDDDVPDYFYIGTRIAESVFETNYPTILKLYNERVLVIGNGSHIHLVDSNNYATTQSPGPGMPITDTTQYWKQYLNVTMGTFSVDAFNFPDGYVIQWIDCTQDTIYAGATKLDPSKKFRQVGDSVVLAWQFQSDSQTVYRIDDGETIGKCLNNYLYILTCKGNIKILYSGQMQQITKVYQLPDDYTIKLPHPNGVDIYDDKIAFLLPGNKFSPAGIYVFDPETKNVYHKNSPYYTTTTAYDIGGNQSQITTGALLFLDKNKEDMFFAGIDNVMKQDGSFIGGLFDTGNIQNYTLNKAGYVELGRIKSTELDEYADSYAMKYRGVGTIILSQKKVETFTDSTDGKYTGNWGSNVTNPTTFTMTSVPTFMKKGDRISVLDGVFAGFSTTIKSISSTTITIDPASKYSAWDTLVGNSTFTFLWERNGYNGAFTSATTMTVDASVAALMAVGDEIEFIAGLNAGYINYVYSIVGTTITLALSGMNYTASNYTVFNIDKYTYLSSYTSTASNTNIIDERSNEPLESEFVQYKLILSGAVKLREFQVNVKPNLSIDSRISGRYSSKGK